MRMHMVARFKLMVIVLWPVSASLLVASCERCGTLRVSSGIQANISEVPPIPIARAGHAGGLVDGRVVVAGGSNWSDDRSTKNWLDDSFVFVNGRWKKGPLLPLPTSDAFYAYDANGLYIAGGSDGTNQTNKAYRLSATTPKAAWQSLSALPYPMSEGSGAILAGHFYICCGYAGKTLSNQLWYLNITHPDSPWRRGQSLPGPPRAYPAVVSCGDYLYLLGGLVISKNQPTLTVLRDAYRYDPESDQWQRLPDLPFTGYAWSAAAVDDHRILLTARAAEKGNVSRGIWIVNVDTMTPTKIGETVMRACCAPLVQVHRNTWWLVGGEPDTTRNRTARVTSINLTQVSPN